MRRSPLPQLRLNWDRNPWWERMPESQRRDCQELLTQLLCQVVRTEFGERSPGDEREDPADAS
jgi:hypothetical protein